MKKYSLLLLVSNSNREIANTLAENKEQAVIQLKDSSPLFLDETGYGKIGNITCCVAENF